MMSQRACLLGHMTFWSALILGGCVANPSVASVAPLPPPSQVQRDTPFVIADTDEDIWPNPIQRTYVRLSVLRRLIAEFTATRRRLPSGVQELSLLGDPLPPRMTNDAWNNPIAFSRQGAEYELRALGPDGIMDTPDDLVLRPGQEVPIIEDSDPSAATLVTMKSMQRLIRVYRDRTSRLPQSVEDLGSAGLRPYLGTLDEWGNEIRYTRTSSDIELRSSGPDGEFGSRDDLVITGLSR